MKIRLLIPFLVTFTFCSLINSDGHRSAARGQAARAIATDSFLIRGVSVDPEETLTAQDAQKKPIVLQPTPIYTLRVHAIRFSNDDGSQETPTSPQQFNQWVDKANTIFYNSSAGIQLKFDPNPNGPDWETKKNTALNHLTSSKPATWKDATALADKYHGKILFILRFSPDDGNTGNGFAFPPQLPNGTNFVVLPGFNNTEVSTGLQSDPRVQNIWLLAHETGHYLGLPHTFPGWNDAVTDTPLKAAAYIESHGGTVDALDGDLISDTPPEAGTAFYHKQGWNTCTGQASYTITGGARPGGARPFSFKFTPDRHNLMSYFACDPMKLTKGQVARMRQTLQLPVRKHLIGLAPVKQPDPLKKIPPRP